MRQYREFRGQYTYLPAVARFTFGSHFAGRRTRTTWADGFYVGYDHLVTGEVSAIREYGATSGAGVLASYAYDNLGRRTGLTRGNGTVTAYGHDGASRLTSLAHDLAGSANDLTHGFTWNPASQIATLTRSNGAYAWGGHVNVDRAYAVNGLNQYTGVGALSLTHDANGNLTSDGTSSYRYDRENRLIGAAGGETATLTYDPLGRLSAILEGRQPSDLTARRLLDIRLPLDWADQAIALGMSEPAAR